MLRYVQAHCFGFVEVKVLIWLVLQLEMQVAILNQEMRTAAEEERFKEAAQFRDRLENLRLKQRCMQVEHREGLRNSICHRIGI